MTSARTLRTLLAIAVVGTGLLLATRAARGADATPSAVPPPARPATTNLDEWLAFVDGEFITRRMIQREIGERAEEQSEEDYETQIRSRVLRRVLNGVMVRKAKMMGLELRPDLIDKYAEEASKVELEKAREREERRKPGAGKNLTYEKILAERGQTMAEFKELITREVLVSNYWSILERGVPGKRKLFDAEASPDDILKLWREHGDRFDQKHGVRLAMFYASPESFMDEGRRSYEESVLAARAHLEAILAEARANRSPEAVVRARGLPETDWDIMPADQFLEPMARSGPAKAADEWAFDPARKPGDSGVFDAARGRVGGYYILEVRPARKKTFDEVRPDLGNFIREARVQRFRVQHMLECLASSTIQPPEVTSAIEEQLRHALKAFDEDPVKKSIRLR
jgi:hypothetical protein